MAIVLNDSLRAEYVHLFTTCSVWPGFISAAENRAGAMVKSRLRYEAATHKLGVPWYVAAVIHHMESSGNFMRHLHNGDPLTARTTHVPAGRPVDGKPPFLWEASAADALWFKGLDAQRDWSLPATLYVLEGYNGWGYRQFHPDVLSPYLWGLSNHHKRGKYVADGTWSQTAETAQLGAAVLLKILAANGTVSFPDAPASTERAPPWVPGYRPVDPYRDPETRRHAIELQKWLSTYLVRALAIDGVLGPRTSEAYRLVTGHYLPGDPRA